MSTDSRKVAEKNVPEMSMNVEDRQHAGMAQAKGQMRVDDSENAHHPNHPNQLDQPNQQLERNIIESMEAIKRLKDEIVVLKTQNKQICQNFDEVSTAYLREKGEVQRARDETQRIAQAKAVQEKEMDSKMQAWKKELSERTKEFEQVKSALRPPWELDIIRIQAIEELERAYEAKFEAMEKELKSAQQLKHEHELLRANVEMEQTEHERTIESLRTQYQVELAQLKTKLAGFEAALDSTDTDRTIEDLEREVAELKGRKKILEEDSSSSRDVIATLQREKDNLRRENRRSVLEFETQVKLLEGEKETLVLRIQRADAQIAQYREGTASLSRRNAELQSQCTKLKTDLGEARLSASEEGKQADALYNARLKQADSDAAAARRDLETYRKLAVERETELENAKRMAAKQQAEMDEKINMIRDEEKATTESLREEIRSLEGRIAEKAHENERIVVALKSQLSAKGKELSDAYETIRRSGSRSRPSNPSKAAESADADVDMEFGVEDTVGESSMPVRGSSSGAYDQMNKLKRKLKETISTARRNREHYKRRLADTQARYDAISNQVALQSLEGDVARQDVELTKQRLEAMLSEERRRREEAEVLLRVSLPNANSSANAKDAAASSEMQPHFRAVQSRFAEAEIARVSELDSIGKRVDEAEKRQALGIDGILGRQKVKEVDIDIDEAEVEPVEVEIEVEGEGEGEGNGEGDTDVKTSSAAVKEKNKKKKKKGRRSIV